VLAENFFLASSLHHVAIKNYSIACCPKYPIAKTFSLRIFLTTWSPQNFVIASFRNHAVAFYWTPSAPEFRPTTPSSPTHRPLPDLHKDFLAPFQNTEDGNCNVFKKGKPLTFYTA
jgi:hypothetical protein